MITNSSAFRLKRSVITAQLLVVIMSLAGNTAQSAVRRWDWNQGSQCRNCRLIVEVNNPDIDRQSVRLFAAALGANKQSIMRLYSSFNSEGKITSAVTSDEYNLLAKIAFGILGCESKFYSSYKYRFKESLPELVRAAKEVQSILNDKKVSANSRGPTQIKNIPEKITTQFGITADSLQDPDKAAIATMGFLIETLGTLKRLSVKYNLDYINERNYEDYLPYLYYGNSKALINRTATPEQNLYVQKMKENSKMVDLLEAEYESAR